MLPDTGERYLSTPVFENIAVEMNEEELALSRSTPNFRFDVRAPGPPSQAERESDALDAEAIAFVDELLSDARQPVVLFALEWCEFCWSVRKLFNKLGIPFCSVDLDSVAYQEANRGGEIRKVLKSRLRTNNIPQIFIAGTHIGGSTDLFDAWNENKVKPLLQAAGVTFSDPGEDFDANSLLPGWRHKG
jgi:cysteine synthase A